jgi:hypothetical protein
MPTAAYYAYVAALAGSPVIRYHDVDTLALADNANVTAFVASDGSGLTLAPVPVGGANQAKFSTTAGHPSGWRSIRFDGTGGLYAISSATANIFANTGTAFPGSPVARANATYHVGMYITRDVVVALTQHLLCLSSSTNNNPFFLLGNTSAQLDRSSKRNDSGAPSNGTNGTSVTLAATGWHTWIFEMTGSPGTLRGDIFIDNVSATAGVGFAFDDATAATIDLYCIGCLYRPQNGASQVGSAFTGNGRRWVSASGFLGSTARALLHTLLSEAPQVQASAVMPNYSVWVIGSSTADGNSLPNPNDAWPIQLQARLGFTMTKRTTSSGLEPYHTVATSVTNPAPFPAPDPVYSITTAVAAAPTLILYHVLTGRGYQAYLDYVALGYGGGVISQATLIQYMEDMIATVMSVVAVADAANIPILLNAVSQPSPTFTFTQDIYMGRYFRQRFHTLLGYRFLDIFALLANADGTANTSLFIASNTHPNAIGQTRLADAWESRVRSFPRNQNRIYQLLEGAQGSLASQNNGNVAFGGQLSALVSSNRADVAFTGLAGPGALWQSSNSASVAFGGQLSALVSSNRADVAFAGLAPTWGVTAVAGVAFGGQTDPAVWGVTAAADVAFVAVIPIARITSWARIGGHRSQGII